MKKQITNTENKIYTALCAQSPMGNAVWLEDNVLIRGQHEVRRQM